MRVSIAFPSYSLAVACGMFGHEHAVEPLGWVCVSGYHGKRNENLYVVRAVGRSMEPTIKDGALCVFEYRHGQLERDAIVPVEHTGVIDGGTQGESKFCYNIAKLPIRRNRNEERLWREDLALSDAGPDDCDL